MKETQRQTQNRRMREIKLERKLAGVCVTCGDSSRPGKVQCCACSDAGKERYRLRSLGLPPVIKYRRYASPRTQTGCGVALVELADGYGRVGTYYMATAMIGGKQFRRKFSIGKYGASTAKELATMQRQMWLMEAGIVKKPH